MKASEQEDQNDPLRLRTCSRPFIIWKRWCKQCRNNI